MGKINARRSSPDARRRKYIKSVAKLFKSKLFGVNEKKINLKIVDNRLISGFPPFADGLAYEVKPLYYMIGINNAAIPTKERMLEVIAHEMGHLQQMYVGDLKEDGNGGVIWRKRSYPNDSLNHSVVADWYNRPWEIHAEGVKDFLIKGYEKELEC